MPWNEAVQEYGVTGAESGSVCSRRALLLLPVLMLLRPLL